MVRSKAAALVALLAAVAPCFASPLAAQDSEAPPSLEDLIPDEAVADPEAWAAQGVPAETAAEVGSTAVVQGEVQEIAPPDPGIELPADAPLDDLPEITLPWPEEIELSEIAPLEPEEEIEFTRFDDVLPQLPEGTDERISDELVLSSRPIASCSPIPTIFSTASRRCLRSRR